MPEVECSTLNGQTIKVPSEKLILRPAVYAIIIKDEKLLLLSMRENGKYHLPGGGILAGERMETALRRELREETGIELGEIQFAYFEEIFFYYDPSGRAYHGLHFFYLCQAKSTQLLKDEQVEDGSAEHPRWVDIKTLNQSDFQANGEAILRICRSEIAS